MAALSLPFAPPYGVIVSNDLLHHLHNPAMQWQAVVQWAGPGALVVERHAADAPAFLRRDFANSLAAAFPPQEVEAQMGAAGLTC